jgi:hypothetical protein
MTKKQIKHYLKGGKFNAIYNPTKLNIAVESRLQIGNIIVVHQNMIITPILSIKEYEGQHAFNCDSIAGWFPEEDIKHLEIIDEFIDTPEKLPHYMYKLHYSTKEQLTGNFGNAGMDLSLPYTTGREYSNEMDSYIKMLSTPAADKIEKAIYTGETEEVTWETI